MGKFLVSLFFISFTAYSQTLTQTVKGFVKDKVTQEPLVGANIELLDSDPPRGDASDNKGYFLLRNIPVGRQSFKISMLGYKSYFVKELMITSGKEVVFDILLEQSDIDLKEVVFVHKIPKNRAINSMATVSSRKFTVEETQKYAGGMDDPARLVTSFGGVASTSVNNNGISVRGNSPSGLLWRIEGVDVPSPNHFADLIISGSGLLTVLSSQMLGNSDFFTGAFPAEYGNATSGVFDINLRSGNNSKREYTLAAGLLGLDFAIEGPFMEESSSSYLLNYRYSTLGLVSSLFPQNNEYITYQDLAFKINIPTQSLGEFSIWGIGAYDQIKIKALGREEWEDIGDRENSSTYLNLFATAINHNKLIISKSFLSSSLSLSGYGLSHRVGLLNNEMVEIPKSKASKYNYKLTFQTNLKTYFSEKHINSTGFCINNLFYNLNLSNRDSGYSYLQNIVNDEGVSLLFQFYTQSKFKFSSNLSLNMGFHSQYFRLNKKYTIEPRLSVKYELDNQNSFSLAYGLHSKIEPLSIYFIKDSLGNYPNKSLDIMKSNHFVLSFSTMIIEDMNLTIEPYFQYLTDLPVASESYISTINNNDNLFFNKMLLSKGTGRNIGVDFTLEHYLKRGFYYMLTASFFDSKYKAADGIERNTRFNKNYVINAIVGKEWELGKSRNSFLSANLRFNYLGGNRADVINESESFLQQKIVYGETNGNIAFEKKHKDCPILSFTLSYRKNHSKYSSVLSLQLLNATSTKEFQTYIFNQKKQRVEEKYGENMIPNISCKIEF
ncbi:MAG: prevent-host-death protein [Candidatus Cloacimonadota bacterium]|nr:MAG: prevent-host-death protein [Candidatus Cloacimonadota bacterium]PIE78949.1 MAG: prevent-host-death protein [Candidatus Delongbacteria bacterium]